MSIGKTLAKKYLKKDLSRSEKLLEKIKYFNLEPILGNFQKSLKIISEDKDFYELCIINSSEKLSDNEIESIRLKYNIATDAESKNYIDENILGGVVVYYQGKKWDESTRGIFNRFNEK